ncbi:hypothetical protein U1E44_09575 [Arenibacter sp. GZD96]|uniref:DUF7009 family protein n=1 Tax=Aurantibrevibacter litoralis TaxID=3106030 RepID=UPI002AFE8D2F|nr:hypothetical protein [Arenibacter sp. GZD-96]MEA1786339.1 hypothetical protein [Arenibacter sp. GZD-96]
MKIRIKGNTIRLRLTRSEVATVATKGYLAEETKFSSSRFAYGIKTKKDLTHLDAQFLEETITVFMPAAMANEWWTSEQVGYAHTVALESGETLHLLIEKDFVCMDESVEDQSDNYPNPAANKLNG